MQRQTLSAASVLFLLAAHTGGTAAFTARQSFSTAAAIPVLQSGESVAREISAEQQHSFDVSLQEGEYALLIVEQRGIDLLVGVRGSGDKPLVEFDEERRRDGDERVEWVADEAGHYMVTVQAKGVAASGGSYEIAFRTRRAATDEERLLHEARRLSADAIRLMTSGTYDQALPLTERALDIRQKVLGRDHRDTARSLRNVGEVYRLKGDFTNAKLLYEQALESAVAAMGADDLLVADMLNAVAVVERRQGNLDRSEELLRRSIAIKEATLGLDHPEVATAVNNLGAVYIDRGDFDRAAQAFQRTLTIREKAYGPGHRNVAAALNNLAAVYSSVGDFEKADQMNRRALAIREETLGPENPEVASTLINMATDRMSTGDLGAAEPLLRRGLALREKAAPDSPDVANAVEELAKLRQQQGDLTEADVLHERALRIWTKELGPEHPLLASALLGRAAIFRIREDYDRAEQMGSRAVTIAERALGPQHPVLADGLGELANIYWAKGNVGRAVEMQLRANDIIDRNIALNLATGSERQKLAYLTFLSEVEDRTVSLHARGAPENAGARELAARAILQHKGRVLDAMTESLTRVRQQFNDADRRLLDELGAVVAQLSRLVFSGPQNVPVSTHQAFIDALQQKREDLEAEISRHSAQYRSRGGSATLEAIRAAVPPDAVLLDFAVYRPFDPHAATATGAYGAPRYIAYVMPHDGDMGWRDLGDARDIEVAIAAFRAVLRDPHRNDVDRLARDLDEKIAEPLRPLIGGVTHLIVSPDGGLDLIPFEALLDRDGHYLVERYAVTYLTSGRDLMRLQVPRESRSGPLVVASPVFGEPAASLLPNGHAARMPADRRSVTMGAHLSDLYFAPLTGARLEAQDIGALFEDATVVTGSRATKGMLTSANAPRLLHIATHGFFLEDASTNPLLRSGLALAGANLRDPAHDNGILTALEASALNLWGTKLVTLSACDTGLGEVRNGEGVQGLRRALAVAGAETVMISLWPVSDSVTRELMRDFYKGLQQGLGRGEALRRVQLAMLTRKGRQHPFYWGSFIQSGEWANLDGKR